MASSFLFAAVPLAALLARSPELDVARIDDLVMGNANGSGEDNRNVGRIAALLAGLPVSVPANTVNRMCGSSLHSTMIASSAVETGYSVVVIAASVESMTRSHQRADAGWRDGFYDGHVVPVSGVTRDRDEGIRADASIEALAKLKPAFADGGSITAGNASPLNDGAPAVLVGGESAAAIGQEPLARIAGRGVYADEPRWFGYSLVGAAGRALKQAGLTWSDIGDVELNEAFAAQSLTCLDAWDTDPELVNQRGGPIAIGHPLGASGGRVLATLANVLRETGSRYGVAAICIGIDIGLAVVLENLNTDTGQTAA